MAIVYRLGEAVPPFGIILPSILLVGSWLPSGERHPQGTPVHIRFSPQMRYEQFSVALPQAAAVMRALPLLVLSEIVFRKVPGASGCNPAGALKQACAKVGVRCGPCDVVIGAHQP